MELLKFLISAVAVAAVLVPWLGAAAVERVAPHLQIEHNDQTVSIFRGDRLVLEYQLRASPKKPYVKRLFSPAGVQVLRDSPRDHQHHHALMFSLGVDGVDFWSETARCGREQPRSLESVKTTAAGGTARAGFTQGVDWLGPDGGKLLVEQRTIEWVQAKDVPASLVTWRSVLSVPPGKDAVRLTGRHYFGLGIRFVQSMDTVGRRFNAAGEQGELVRGDERLVRANWQAFAAKADGKPVTVAMFDHPQNARHPAHFFSMVRYFAYISATLNLEKEPLVLKAGKPLDLRYGVAVWDGEVGASGVDEVYRRWIELTPAPSK